jgi:hypothetical protein
MNVRSLNMPDLLTRLAQTEVCFKSVCFLGKIGTRRGAGLRPATAVSTPPRPERIIQGKYAASTASGLNMIYTFVNMIIRAEQMKAFEEAAVRNFKQELAEHCRAFAPGLAEEAGPANVARFVESGLERARSYGFKLRGPTRLYIELMLSFGWEFETDGQLHWVRAVNGESEMGRAQALKEAAAAYIERVMGPEREHAIAALGRLARFSPDMWQRLSGPFDARLGQLLCAAFPEKFQYAGAAAVRALIPRAADVASRAGVKLEMAVVLLAMLMFIFGQGAPADPMYAWISAGLTDPKTPNPQDRVGKLYEQTRSYAERALREIQN